MSSEINDQAVTVQTLVLPAGVNIAVNSLSSLTATTGSLATDVSKLGSLFIGNGASWISPTFGLLYGNSGVPTLEAGAGAGTSPTLSITGNDLVGTISITVGSSPAVGISTYAILTMTKASSIRPQPILSLATVSAPVASVPPMGAASISTTQWAIRNYGTAALTAGATYTWNYFVPSL